MSEGRKLALKMLTALIAVIVYGVPLVVASEIVNHIIDWVAAIW